MKCESMEVLALADGRLKIELISTDRSSGNHLTMLSVSGKPLNVEIKQWREKRSRTANGYIWQLLEKLADVLGSTKVEIYQEAVRQVGLFQDWEMTSEAVKEFASAWMSKGIGWLVEIDPSASHDGLTLVRCYKGSSAYDTKQMSRLIDYVVEECKEQGIETMSPNEIAKMMEAHG